MFKYLICIVSLLCSTQLYARNVDVQVFGRAPLATFQLLEPSHAVNAASDSAPPTLTFEGVRPELNTATSHPEFRPASIDVPAWMRGEPRTTSIFRRDQRSVFTSCLPVVYRPFPGLSSAAEARRELYFQDMVHAACVAGVPVHLFDSLIVQESRYNPWAMSPAGAAGITQLMPGTARELRVADVWDVRQNLQGGARYLRQQLDEFGEWHLALSAYNAGPGHVRRHGGIPPFRETVNYVRSILAGVDLESALGGRRTDRSRSRRHVSILSPGS